MSGTPPFRDAKKPPLSVLEESMPALCRNMSWNRRSPLVEWKSIGGNTAHATLKNTDNSSPEVFRSYQDRIDGRYILENIVSDD